MRSSACCTSGCSRSSAMGPGRGRSSTSRTAAHVEAAETLSMAFLLVLDRLNPVERAVFLLHDVFGYEFAEIASIVDRSEANCRQIAVRARRHVRAEKPRLDASRRERDAVARRFFEAMTSSDVDGLTQMLAADVV